MNKQDQEAMKQLEGAKQQLLRGTWTSPDTTAKKETWYIQCHETQVAGKPEAGRVVYVTKSRGAFQLVELLENMGAKTDNNGLAVSLWTAKVLA
jgi:hypothetical protein